MNRKKIWMIAGTILINLCFVACGKTPVDNAEAYGEIIAGLGDEEAYAFLVMDTDHHVLLTSDLIYDLDTARQASACCQVYYYSSGETRHAGTITGEGTAYPLKFSKSGIYIASNHSVEKYALSDKDGLLHLECGIYEIFDEAGSASYTAADGESETVSSQADYSALMDEYDKSQIIHFSYGASGCMNEILSQ